MASTSTEAPCGCTNCRAYGYAVAARSAELRYCGRRRRAAGRGSVDALGVGPRQIDELRPVDAVVADERDAAQAGTGALVGDDRAFARVAAEEQRFGALGGNVCEDGAVVGAADLDALEGDDSPTERGVHVTRALGQTEAVGAAIVDDGQLLGAEGSEREVGLPPPCTLSLPTLRLKTGFSCWVRSMRVAEGDIIGK
jgi:hypothetical protein